MLTIIQKRNAFRHSLLSAASAWEPQAFRLPLLSGAASVYVLTYFGLWQDSAIAQCAQLQPQEDFPFFLSLTSLRIIAATIRMSTKDTMIVLRLSVIQFNILTDSFHPICFVCSAYIIHRRGFFQTGLKKPFAFIT